MESQKIAEKSVEEIQDQRSQDLLIGLRKITQAIDLHSKRLLKTVGITGPQLVILQELATNDELSISEISNRVSLSQGTVTEIILRLEKKLCISKRKSDQDKRKTMVSITNQGRQLLDSAPSPLQEKFINEFHSLKEWEQQMLLSSINRIVEMMSADNIEASPFLVAGPIQKTPE